MHLWKGDKKIGQGPPPAPHLDKIQKTSNFFRETFPHMSRYITYAKYLQLQSGFVVDLQKMS